MNTVLKVLEEEPQAPREINPKVDRALELICLKCLQKKPEDRYGSADALAADLGHWLADEPISVRPPSINALMRLWLRQNFGAGGWTVVVGIVFGLLFGALLWTATIQGDMASVAKYYDLLPDEPRPFLLHFDWEPPQWIALTFIGLAVVSIGYLGYFTAILVNPKHLNADIAAGLVTSLFAGFALFAICIGPMGIHARGGDDLKLLQSAAFRDSDEVMQKWLEKYPDMQQVPANRRAILLYQKIRADNYASVPLGIWTALLMSFAICVVTGVCETMAAGPLLRRQGTWYATFLPYTELGVATAVLMFVTGIYLFMPLLFGGAAFFGWGKLLSLVGSLILAIWAAARRWHWSARTVMQAVWILCFLNFLVYDFMHLPAVGRRQVRIANAERLVDQNPENIQYKLELGLKYESLALHWRFRERWNDAVAPYEKAVTTYGSLFQQELGDKQKKVTTDRLRRWTAELTSVYDHLERHQDARTMLRQFRPQDPGDWRYVARLLRQHLDSMLESGSLQSERKEEYLRDFIQDGLQGKTVKVPPDVLDSLVAWIASTQQWSIIGPFPGGEKFKGLNTTQGPEQATDPKEEYPGVDGTVRWFSVVTHPGYEVNLRDVVSEADFVVAYALIYVESPKAQDVNLRFGSDDGNKFWLNDNLVMQKPVYRVYREGQDRVKLRLRKGTNKLLLKVDQASGEWMFSVEAEDDRGWPVPLNWQTNPK